MQNDYLIRVMDKEKQVRIFLASTQNLVEEAHRRHNTSATASAALGRVLTAAVMMGADLKGEQDTLTLRFNGDGPAGTVLATADSQGDVRGFISNPSADLPSKAPGKLAVGDLVGKSGTLEVIKDLGLKQPFIGNVALESGEIAEDLAKYFMDSEQIPALVSLGVLVAPDLSIQSAGGLIIQALPGADDAVLATIEQNVLRMDSISAVMDQREHLEEVIEMIMSGLEFDILSKEELFFQCTCSQERLTRVLAGLSQEQLSDHYEQEQNFEITCNFCREVYSISKEDIEGLRKKPE